MVSDTNPSFSEATVATNRIGSYKHHTNHTVLWTWPSFLASLTIPASLGLGRTLMK